MVVIVLELVPDRRLCNFVTVEAIAIAAIINYEFSGMVISVRGEFAVLGWGAVPPHWELLWV